MRTNYARLVLGLVLAVAPATARADGVPVWYAGLLAYSSSYESGQAAKTRIELARVRRELASTKAELATTKTKLAEVQNELISVRAGQNWIRATSKK